MKLILEVFILGSLIYYSSGCGGGTDPDPGTGGGGATITPGTNGNGVSCTCGVKTTSRIVGGSETTAHEYPWQAIVVYDGYLRCGGSLISESWVVTAAHCLGGRRNRFGILLGDHDLSITESGQQYLAISSKTRHPGYSSSTLDNDIGLMRLSSPASFSDTVSPICLPMNLSPMSSGDTLTVTGWGSTSSGGSSPGVLHEVDVFYITTAECRGSQYVYGNEITDNMICAGVSGGGKDSCQGDSGGPLSYQDSGSINYLMGVVSWGYGCADAESPGVYTKFDNYLDWINSETGAANEFCNM